jgi:hypothetical protein
MALTPHAAASTEARSSASPLTHSHPEESAGFAVREKARILQPRRDSATAVSPPIPPVAPRTRALNAVLTYTLARILLGQRLGAHVLICLLGCCPYQDSTGTGTMSSRTWSVPCCRAWPRSQSSVFRKPRALSGAWARADARVLGPGAVRPVVARPRPPPADADDCQLNRPRWGQRTQGRPRSSAPGLSWSAILLALRRRPMA